MKYKKGLSGIVTTLITILLVLVAVGVIWQVVGNLLDKSTSTISTSSKCLDIDIRATKVIPGAVAGDYNVTLTRKPTGEGEVGAKLVFYNDNNENSEPITFSEMLAPLRTATGSIQTTGVVNATKVVVTPFFLDEETGKEVLCTTSFPFEFKN